MTFSVFGWAADRHGCGYYRLGLPFDAMRKVHGINAKAAVIIPDELHPADIVVGQRICISEASEHWQRMAEAGQKLVFEIDDNLWNVHYANELAGKFFADHPKNPSEVIRRLSHNAATADLATVTSEGLAKIVRQFNPNVAILPNGYDASLLDHERPRHQNLTVGFAGSATHIRDFEVVAKPLRQFLLKNRKVRMHFMGQNYDSLLRINCKHTQWIHEVAAYQRAIDFDIGIIPLSIGKFNDAKSPIKALEFAALGIPVVASDYGPYKEFVKHGETGFLVKPGYDRDWIKYLNLLVEDEVLRDKIGRQAKEYAADFTIQKTCYKWVEAYRKVLG